MSWTGNLLDIQQFSSAGLVLYVRVAYAELEHGMLCLLKHFEHIFLGLISLYFKFKFSPFNR